MPRSYITLGYSGLCFAAESIYLKRLFYSKVFLETEKTGDSILNSLKIHHFLIVFLTQSSCKSSARLEFKSCTHVKQFGKEFATLKHHQTPNNKCLSILGTSWFCLSAQRFWEKKNASGIVENLALKFKILINQSSIFFFEMLRKNI